MCVCVCVCVLCVVCVCVCIVFKLYYIMLFYQVTLTARSSWHSLAVHPNHPSFARQYPVSTESRCMYVFSNHSTQVHLWVEVTNELVFTSPAVPLMSFLDWLWDGKYVAAQLLFFGVLFSRIATFLWSSYQTFSLCDLLAFMWCIHVVVWAQL